MVPATALPGRLADMLGPPCFQHASPHEPAIRPAIAATCTRSIKPILPVTGQAQTPSSQPSARKAVSTRSQTSLEKALSWRAS